MSEISITFVEGDGTERLVQASDSGQTLMEAARMASVRGITADCGGAAACATCHVLVDAEWIDRVGHANDIEADMIDMSSELTPTSRLSCQIELRPELDGLRVSVAAD